MYTHTYEQTMAFNQYAAMDYIIQCQKLAILSATKNTSVLFTAPEKEKKWHSFAFKNKKCY